MIRCQTCVFALLAGMAAAPTLAQDRDPGAAAGAIARNPSAPRSPIQTTLAVQGQPALGQPITLVFTVSLDNSLPQTNATVEFQLPQQVGFRAGELSIVAPLAAGESRQFPLTVSLDKTGSYQIVASAVGGDTSYSYGQRRTLYLSVNGDQVTITDKRPQPAQDLVQSVTRADPNEPITTVPDDVGRLAPPVPADPVTDPSGEPLAPDEGESGGEFGERATATVTGFWYYRHADTTLHGGYGTLVRAWDSDSGEGAGADDLLGSAIAGGDGSFSITFDNNSDVFPWGTADVYLEFRSENGVVNSHSNAGLSSVYTGSTGVLFPNIGGGTFNAGGWLYDTGSPGVADGVERAFEVLDYGSRAWEHVNYGLGYGPHFTYFQWTAGSTDGAYYVRAENQVHLAELDFNSPDVIMHEFGHSVMDSVYGESDWPPGAGGPHSLTGHYTPGLAWTEGWATWYSCSAQGYDQFYDDNNPGNSIHFDCDANWDGFGSANGNSDNQSVGAGREGYDTESAVIAIMVDIGDSRNDSTDLYDWTSLGSDEMWDVTRNYLPSGHHIYGPQEFYNGWFSRGWGYHPQINGQMMVHGMNQGISKPSLGLYDGVNKYSGTWYYGGYGRGSYDVKNYGSQNYDLNQMYVWLRGPAGQDVGQFGGDGNGAVIPARTTRNIWMTAEQTGYYPPSPNFIYGTYTITAGHYRSDSVWQLLEVAEPGTAQQITATVIRDTDAPDYCYVYDDGSVSNSSSTLHIVAYADDYDSSILGYWTRVGTSPGSGNEQDWLFFAANNQTTFDHNITGLTMAPNTTYYVTVVARNIEGYDTWGYSDGIIGWDATPPGPVSVIAVGKSGRVPPWIKVHATSSENDGAILGYWTRLGTSPGAGNVQDWILNTTGDVDVFDHTFTGLPLNPAQTYYVTIVARNLSGLDTWGYSGPVQLVPQIP